MAGEPALVKVQTALVAALQTLTGINILVDRTIDEPVDPSERPAIVPRIVEVTFDTPFSIGETLHTIVVDLDLYAEPLVDAAISSRLAVMQARVIAAIAADRTLGGLMQQFEERSFTADPQSVPDLGCATLTFEGQFNTPRGDFNTILGASGTFP